MQKAVDKGRTKLLLPVFGSFFLRIQMTLRYLLPLLCIIFVVVSCRQKDNPPAQKTQQEKQQPVTLVVQPFTGMPEQFTTAVVEQLRQYYPYVIQNSAVPLPPIAYNAERKRYRADSLIYILSRTAPKNQVLLALTHHDISTTKGAVADWGVMGLGLFPGSACVASLFRLHRCNQACVRNCSRRAEQLFKVAIHEAGHTQGLPHCAEKTCFMRDAEGGNPTDEEKAFCPNCTAYLKTKGWLLK